ncbi:hypothetical protein QCA50_008218 [Cerrena zonata]|uniref:Uncharacterized protein n=1 Tax=Cerrena zonata TaxID=2478898 RepID=A0AAW0G5C2_9APHY
MPSDEPPEEARHVYYSEEHDLLHLETVARRILGTEEDETLDDLTDSISARLRALRGNETSDVSVPSDRTTLATSHGILLAELRKLIDDVQPTQPSTSSGQSVALGVLTSAEWGALARYCSRVNDKPSLHLVFDLMKQSSVPISADTLSSVAEIFSDRGDIQTIETLLEKYNPRGVAVPERLRDLHIKAHLLNETSLDMPTNALRTLHEYENSATPAPQRTYTRLITHLFHRHTAVAHAHAWDLFAHMRYAAHPYPDAVTYTLMIRACATPSFAHGVETERALDLFTEMTVDHEMPPTAGAYTAVILACARASDKKYVHEAFRLAGEMLDTHRDARGHSAYAPDRRLFIALLEGAKRVGDLGRARWILAEMVQASLEDPEGDMFVDEEVMMHVFNAYAAYRPPFKRSQTLVKEELPEVDEQSAAPGPVIENANDPVTTQLPPQTRAAVVSEVESLMARILADNKADSQDLRFKNVHLNPRLLNAYLSVLYVHASFDTWSERYRTIFPEQDVPRSPSTYILALERCARTPKSLERKLALQFAEEVWKEWEAIEASWWSRAAGSVSLSARQVEKANAAMIRMLSITGNLNRALDHVRAFVKRYPPLAIREPPPKHELRSTRTSLTANRPLVRLTTEVDIPDDTVPPLLTFTELDVLHQRLVVANKKDGIKYLKWVCKSYEGSLKMRREKTLHSHPKPVHGDVAE